MPFKNFVSDEWFQSEGFYQSKIGDRVLLLFFKNNQSVEHWCTIVGVGDRITLQPDRLESKSDIPPQDSLILGSCSYYERVVSHLTQLP